MKPEIELSVNPNKSGDPIIKIRHHDKSNSLEQLLVGHFVKRARNEGVSIVHIAGYLCSSEGKSYEDYEIKIGQLSVAKKGKTSKIINKIVLITVIISITAMSISLCSLRLRRIAYEQGYIQASTDMGKLISKEYHLVHKK